MHHSRSEALSKRLNPIRLLQQKGEFNAAITACLTALNEADQQSILEHYALNALLSMLHCQNDNADAGRDCLAVITPSTIPLPASILTDMAGSYILLGESKTALETLDKAIADDPNYSLAIARRGIVLMQTGQFEAAQTDLLFALEHLPTVQQAAVQINLARCAVNLGDTETALDYVEQAKQRGAISQESWLLVAVDTYIALDCWEDAETAIQSSLESNVDNTLCLKLLSLVLAAQNKHEEAEHYIRKALKDDPDNVELLLQLSELASIRGHFGVSTHCLQTALKVEPENAGLWVLLSQLGKHLFNDDDARHAAEQAIALTENKIGIERAEALVAMAKVVSDTGDHGTAEKMYSDALNLVDTFIPAKLGLGHLYLQWGRVDEAITLFEDVSDCHPVAGVGALISARRFPDDKDTLSLIEKVAYTPSLQGPIKSSLLFDLAAVWAHLKDYDQAFHFANEANAACRAFLPYSAKHHQYECNELISTFNQAFFAQRNDYGSLSQLPVFVLGMPRSGTTLVEQILGGHPKIFGAGELGILSTVIQKLNAWEQHVGSSKHYPECVNDLTQEQSQKFAELVLDELREYDVDAHYIVDKMPHNFENIGLIRLLFPQAPIIHVLREPRDVAVSNYFTDYQAKFGGMGFAYDLDDIGKQLMDYKKLMTHWNDISIKPILTVRYEDVVDDVKTQAHRMLDYIGIDWHDNVLNHQNLERAVKTASVWQVRQPIYKTSKDKWRRYEKHLETLEKNLADSALLEHEEVMHKGNHTLSPGFFFSGMDHLKANQGESAQAIFEKILTLDSKHAAATHMLGLAHLQQNHLNKALKLIKTSIQLHPIHAGWFQNLATVYQALGNNKAASDALNKAAHLKTLREETGELWAGKDT